MKMQNIMKRKPSYATAESTLFTVRKDEWNTNEGTGKSMKNALYMYCGMPKGTSLAKAVLNSEKNQVCSLSHCRVMLHQVDSKLVSRN